MDLDPNVQNKCLELVRDQHKLNHDLAIKQMELDAKVDLAFREMPSNLQQQTWNNEENSVEVEEIAEEDEEAQK